MPAIRRVNMFYVVDAATKRCGALTDFE